MTRPATGHNSFQFEYAMARPYPCYITLSFDDRALAALCGQSPGHWYLPKSVTIPYWVRDGGYSDMFVLECTKSKAGAMRPVEIEDDTSSKNAWIQFNGSKWIARSQ